MCLFESAIFYLLLGLLSPTRDYLTIKTKHRGFSAKGLTFL